MSLQIKLSKEEIQSNLELSIQELDAILGQEEARSIITDLFHCIATHQIQSLDKEDIGSIGPLNFIITGNPGTGKTYIAGILGKGLHNLGILATDELVSLNICDLVNADIARIFDENKGKVLLIDEAFALADYPQELSDILNLMSTSDYDRPIVVFAGHEDEMQKLMDSNSGIQRRTRSINLRDFTNEELYEILIRKVETESKLSIDAETCREIGIAYFASIKRTPYFGNAQESAILLNRLVREQNLRFINTHKGASTDMDSIDRILPRDFPQF